MNEAAVPQVTALHPSQSKQLVDEYLLPVLAERVSQARAMDDSYAALWIAIQTLFQAGGKRFRPYMTLLTFQAFSNQPVENALPAAAAQELLHLAMLIHDDIIDRDLVRYGIDNVTAEFLKQYEALIQSEGDRLHYAQSAAILAGDLLISESYLLTTKAEVGIDRIIQAQTVLSDAIFGVVGGELLDTEAAFKKVASAHPLVIAEQKTASYSFVSPFLMGATLGNATSEQKAKLTELGRTLGIAYQIRDDIMGVFGDSSITGKSTEGDIREGKRTLLIDEFYRQATAEQRKKFDELFGKFDASSEEIYTVRKLIEESGAKTAIETMIETYQTRCNQLVDALGMSEDHTAAFRQLIIICLQRER